MRLGRGEAGASKTINDPAQGRRGLVKGSGRVGVEYPYVYRGTPVWAAAACKAHNTVERKREGWPEDLKGLASFP